MIKSRIMLRSDIPALETAIANDTFHPGTWTVDTFMGNGNDHFEIFEDEVGPIAFVKYVVESDTRVRFFTIWSDFYDSKRNAKIIIFGVNQLVDRLRGSQFSELIFSTENPSLAAFMCKAVGFESVGNDDYTLQIKDQHVRPN